MSCVICAEKKKIPINKNNFFFRTDSSDKDLSNYKNYVCYNCGTIYQLPRINRYKLINHYNNDYRETESIIRLNEKKVIDLPIRFEWTGISFSRFYTFYQIVNKKIRFEKNDKILDYGCYQGAFLFACKKIFGAKVIGTDFNDEGLRMAENFFNIETFKTNEKFFLKKINAKMITLLHVFEHLEDPIRFLYKIKKNCLKKNGYVYLEVPNPFSNSLNDPTHLNLYSEDTIKYIFKSCNYEIHTLKKLGNYKNRNFLKDNEDQNIHILARSIDEKKYFFEKINIGNSIIKKLYKRRRFLSFKIVYKKIKFSIKTFLETLYSIFTLLFDFISPKYTILFHEILKKIFK